MAMTVGELVARFDLDPGPAERGILQAELAMRGLQRSADGSIRDAEGRFVSMFRTLDGVGDHADGARDRTDRFHLSLGRVGAMVRPLGSVAMSIGGVAAKLGAVVPAAAGLVTTLEQIGPAAAVGVSALLAVQLATQTVKLATQGVGDAVTAAFDPSKPDQYAKALEKLAPNARAFVRQLHAMAPELKKLQQQVQNDVFAGLAGRLKDLGNTLLPVFRSKLRDTTTALNGAATGVATAAIGLGKSGTLGKALDGANAGLSNLSVLPGRVVTALGQIAAAAGPSFDRLTHAAAIGGQKIGDALDRAFKSGGMQKAIEQAVNLLGDLVDVAANVGKILFSVFQAAQSSGGGLIGTLKEVTSALAGVVASPEVQSGLKAIFGTMSTLAKTVAPLLAQALQAIGPVFAALGPPAQILIKALGDGLRPIIAALGPVLVAAAGAVGELVTALAPLLPVAGQLIADILPVLTPLLDGLTKVFQQAAPLVTQLGQALMQLLAPILAQLPSIITPLVGILTTLTGAVLPILTQLLVALGPSLGTIAETFGDLAVALAPVLEQVAELVAQILTALMPVLTPVIGLIGQLAGILAGELATQINTIVVPALRMISQLLSGDFSGAFSSAKQVVSGVLSTIVRMFWNLPQQVFIALGQLAIRVGSRAWDAAMTLQNKINRGILTAVSYVADLPRRAANALAGIGVTLWDAGSRLIGGFINGIVSRFNQVRSTLSSLTNLLPDWKGPAGVDAKILTGNGALVMRGFMAGIDSQVPALRSQLGGITGDLPGMTRTGPATGGGGGGRPIALTIMLGGHTVGEALIDPLRKAVKVRGGNVQAALGR